MKKKILAPLIKIIPFPLIKNMSPHKVVIFYYHVVNDEDVPHIRHLYKYKGTKQFIDDLEFLQRNYFPIGLADVIGWVGGKKDLRANCLLLTFDDGFRENFDVIAPILLDKGIPATFFICSAFLDNRELCYQHKASLLVERVRQGISPGTKEAIKDVLMKNDISFSHLCEGILRIDYSRRDALDKVGQILLVDFKGYLAEKQPYLTGGQVKSLTDRGFTIGGHSIDHPYYSAISLAEQMEQTIVSVKRLREAFRLDYGAFAFPHNDTGVSAEFFKYTQESGLVDITFGTGGMLDGTLRSHRQRISLEKPMLPARELIAWQLMRRVYRQFKRRMKRAR